MLMGHSIRQGQRHDSQDHDNAESVSLHQSANSLELSWAWSWKVFFRIHQGLWFCYVFLASLTLNLPAQKCSPHHAPNMCVHVNKGNFIAIWYFYYGNFFIDIEKMFSWYQTFKYILITMWLTCMVWFFALVVFSNSNFSTYKPLWYI